MPAFSGLFAPYWKSNARGVIAGLTRYVNAGHIARAALEATACQSREIVEAMNNDSGVALESLKVDGGMVGNDLLMQFQADLLGVPVIRPKVPETTSLGAAYAAGLATGFWNEVEDLRENWVEDKRWEPTMDAERARRVLQVLEEGGHPHVRLVRGRRGARRAGGLDRGLGPGELGARRPVPRRLLDHVRHPPLEIVVPGDLERGQVALELRDGRRSAQHDVCPWLREGGGQRYDRRRRRAARWRAPPSRSTCRPAS